MSDTARAGLTAALITTGLFAAATVGIIVFGRESGSAEVKGSKAEGGKGAKQKDERAGTKPKATKEGLEWNLKELGEYLIAKGVIDVIYKDEESKVNGMLFIYNDDFGAYKMTATQHNSPKEARDYAGTFPSSFNWGRIVLVSHKEYLNRVRKFID
jgi:hypothetical protein